MTCTCVVWWCIDYGIVFTVHLQLECWSHHSFILSGSWVVPLSCSMVWWQEGHLARKNHAAFHRHFVMRLWYLSRPGVSQPLLPHAHSSPYVRISLPFLRLSHLKDTFQIIWDVVYSETLCYSWLKCAMWRPLPSYRHRWSNDDCLEVKRENYQVCSVQYCVQQLCTVQCTHIGTDLTVVCWLDLAFLWLFCVLQLSMYM